MTGSLRESLGSYQFFHRGDIIDVFQTRRLSFIHDDRAWRRANRGDRSRGRQDFGVKKRGEKNFSLSKKVSPVRAQLETNGSGVCCLGIASLDQELDVSEEVFRSLLLRALIVKLNRRATKGREGMFFFNRLAGVTEMGLFYVAFPKCDSESDRHVKMAVRFALIDDSVSAPYSSSDRLESDFEGHWDDSLGNSILV